MKKRIAVLMVVLTLITGAAGCSTSGGTLAADTTEAASGNTAAESQNTQTVTESAAVTEEEAKEIALSHAGLQAEDVTFIKSGLELDDGKQKYEVEFYSGNTEYDYDIDAASGEILSFDSDIENYQVPAAGQNSGEDIGEAKAKEIALAKVSGAAESNMRINQDYDNGILVYEGTIIYNEMEYDFEMKASDGTILEWSSESAYDD